MLSWSDILAWTKLTGRRPTRLDLDLITLLEMVDLDVLTSKPGDTPNG